MLDLPHSFCRGLEFYFCTLYLGFRHLRPNFNPFTHPLRQQCSDFHHRNDTCQFVKQADDCQPESGFINYLELPFCLLHSEPPAIVIMLLWLIYLFVALGIGAEDL